MYTEGSLPSSICHFLPSETMLPGVRYSFDVWHAAKNVGKRLNAYAVKAKYKKLRPWISHLKNHFWWCARTSEGNDAIFRVR